MAGIVYGGDIQSIDTDHSSPQTIHKLSGPLSWGCGLQIYKIFVAPHDLFWCATCGPLWAMTQLRGFVDKPPPKGFPLLTDAPRPPPPPGSPQLSLPQLMEPHTLGHVCL